MNEGTDTLRKKIVGRFELLSIPAAGPMVGIERMTCPVTATSSQRYSCIENQRSYETCQLVQGQPANSISVKRKSDLADNVLLLISLRLKDLFLNDSPRNGSTTPPFMIIHP